VLARYFHLIVVSIESAGLLLLCPMEYGVKIALCLFGCVVKLGLVLSSALTAQAQLVKVRAVYPSVDVQYLPAHLGQAMGFFKEEGLEVEFIVMRGGRLGVQALLSGDAQFIMPLGVALSAIWNGADLRILAQMTNMLPFSLVVRPEIQRLEDLRGKKIGVTVGATTFALVREVLKLKGIDPDKGIEYVNLSGTEPKVAALEKGLIAAAPLAPPTELKVIQAGFKRLIFFGDILPEMSFTGLVATSRYIKENPKTVDKMVRGMVRATYFVRDESDAAVGTMQGYLRMNPDEARETYRVIRKAFSPHLTELGVKRMASLISDATGVKATKEPKEFIEASFLNRALSELRKN
jgi:NitT/TauT family transport system substrate-binding protein